MAKSKTPRNSLQAVLDRQSGTSAQEAAAEPAADAPPPAPPRRGRSADNLGAERSRPVASGSSARPSREGKRLVAGHFPPAVAKQLKILAAEEETSVQALLEEALDLLFVKKGKGHIGRQ